MLVKDLIKQLKELPQDSKIIITAMDDYFTCSDFEVHSAIDDEDTAQEIIMNVYINDYEDGDK